MWGLGIREGVLIRRSMESIENWGLGESNIVMKRSAVIWKGNIDIKIV